ncbi:MAG TPA: tRNA pseudouridine synthase A [Pseudolysinimonas sp.]|nr:tRNA pseudouridine synthase A [Pseudolysinimonas sp.]
MSEAGERTRVRLDIAYDGAAFAGWARQPGLRTVQGELEAALAELFTRFGSTPTLTVAGRTDVGVHAIGQVAHVDLGQDELHVLRRVRGSATSAGAPSLARRLNGIAGASGSDVVVVRSAEAPAGFDARFSALWRRYEYRIADAGAEHDPRRRDHTLWHPTELSLDAMNETAGSLLGLHDFAAYCRPRAGATTIRTLQEFRWTRDRHGVLVAEVRADAFCHSMVRALVGACVAVGEGRLGGERPAQLRDAGARSSEFVVAPAKGLTLAEVGYPPDDELAARAEQTRARRALAIPEQID